MARVLGQLLFAACLTLGVGFGCNNAERASMGGGVGKSGDGGESGEGDSTAGGGERADGGERAVGGRGGGTGGNSGSAGIGGAIGGEAGGGTMGGDAGSPAIAATGGGGSGGIGGDGGAGAAQGGSAGVAFGGGTGGMLSGGTGGTLGGQVGGGSSGNGGDGGTIAGEAGGDTTGGEAGTSSTGATGGGGIGGGGGDGGAGAAQGGSAGAGQSGSAGAGLGGSAGAGLGGSAGGAAAGGTGGAPTQWCTVTPEMCEAIATVNSCGFTCSSGQCQENVAACPDSDGDGVPFGPECACGETDCDDADPAVGAGPLPCYTGPTGTLGVGACTGGRRRCTDSLGVCSGEIVPSAESCNLEDDDCDGVIDDVPELGCGLGVCARIVAGCDGGAPATCIPNPPLAATDGCNGEDDDCDGSVDEDCATCLHVAPDGDDTTAIATNGALPFHNVQPALDFADAHRGIATRVCVANGPSCSATATFAGPTGSDLTMHDGISLSGGYESTTWSRCAGLSTRLAPTTGAGVLFPASIATRTVLDGFVIERAPAATTAGVTVQGGRGVLLVGLTITNEAAADNSYGVNVIDGGDVALVESDITSGDATVEGIALRSVGSRVAVTGSSLSAGNDRDNNRTTFFAALLSDSPGSIIDESSLESRIYAMTGTGTLAALRVVGDATDTVIRGNTVETFARCQLWSPPADGISAEACGASSPWVLENSIAIACPNDLDADCGGTCRAAHTGGACHPVLERNTIRAAASPRAIAVDCTVLDGTPSRCVVADNPDIRSSALANPVPMFNANSHYGYGVYCDGASCGRIDGNSVVGNAFGQRAVTCSHCNFSGIGVFVSAASPLVARNMVAGGCGNTSTGVLIGAMSGSRIENNVMEGRSEAFCGIYDYLLALSSGVGSRSVGLAMSGDPDVHSNVIRGGGHCVVAVTASPQQVPLGTRTGTSAGVVLSSYYRPVLGTFRNNVVFAGECQYSTGFDLQVTAAGAFGAFEHNDVLPGPPGLLFRVGFGSLPYLPPFTNNFIPPSRLLADTAAELNALPRSSGNLSVDPAFADRYHLLPGSPCIDAGTATGAPARDLDGDVRDVTPDIGADER